MGTPQPKRELRLTLDARKRISLAKLLPDFDICHVKAYLQEGKIILEPMAEIPAYELWVHQNPQVMADIQEGIQESYEGKILSKGSFAEYLDDEI